MYRLKKILSLMALLTMSQTTQAVSPWMLSEGEFYFSGGVDYSTNKRRWDDTSHLEKSSCQSHDQKFSPTVEYGYSYYYTLTANLALQNKDCGDDDFTGIGDIRLGIRGRLNIYENGKTWELTAIIPTGYSRHNPARPGNGSFGIEGGLGYLSRGEYRDYAKRWDFLTGASIRIWASGPADQFLYYATIRRHIGKYANISAGISADISFQNEGDSRETLSDGRDLSDYDEVTAKISFSDRLNNKWRYKLSGSHVVWGRSTGHDLKVGISFSRHWGR